MSTVKITVSGPIGIGKSTLLAKIKTLVLGEAEAEGLEIQWEHKGFPKTSQFHQQLFKETCQRVKEGAGLMQSASYLKGKGVDKIVFREKDTEKEKA